MNRSPQSHRNTPPRVAAGCVLMAGLVAAWIWAAEPWQRPLALLHISDATWLATAVVGIGASTAIWPLRGHRRWLWRAVVSAALCSIILPVCLNTQSTTAVKALLQHDHVLEIGSPHIERPEPVKSWSGLTKDWSERVRETWRHQVLYYFAVPRTPPPAKNRLEAIRPPDDYDHLLETSRWQTRRAFLRAILTDESRVRLATHHWHRMFPAVIGQDVSLAHRVELLEWLDRQAADDSAPATCRDAAAFWMALIILTDAEAFAPWSERALAHMLASTDPPESTARLMWMRPSGDVWMRALDLLLAMTPEETHGDLTAPLTRDATLLRRAARQRVRGLQHHADAILREIEFLDRAGQYVTAAAVWLDLKRITDAFADTHLANTIHKQLASTMEAWLIEDSGIVTERFSSHAYPLLTRFPMIPIHENFTIPISREAADRLLQRVHADMDKLENVNPEGSANFPVELDHARIIASFLTEDERKSIHNRVAVSIAQWMSRHAENLKKGQAYTAANAILTVTDDLDPASRLVLKQALLQWGVFNDRNAHYWQPIWRTIVDLDATCLDPELSGAERVALSTGQHQRFKPPPPLPPEDIEDFLQVVLAEEPPTRMGDVFRLPRARLARARTRLGAMADDELRFRAYRSGMIGAEHLPDDWVGFVRAKGMKLLYNLRSANEVWEPFASAPKLLMELLEHPDSEGGIEFHAFFEYLENHPPSPEVRHSLMNHISQLADSEEDWRQMNAFKILLRFSDWFDEPERREFRERIHRFFLQERPSIQDWGRIQIRNHAHDWYIDARNHRGEWIPWEDDALSAALSWSSQIHHELASLPPEFYPETGVFRHLMISGAYFDSSEWNTPEYYQLSLDHIAPNALFPDPARSFPFATTPWQRARDLHQRRPDLKFPSRPIFRPSEDRVRLRKESYWIED